jgi:bifunctional DNA-binding transcriptional regulator/antitoxin component of YhaV-PrlF toxin-antitoxin module
MADVTDLYGETLAPEVVPNEKTDDVEVAPEGVFAKNEIFFAGLKLRRYSEIDRKVKINPKGTFTIPKELAAEFGITKSKNNVVISLTEDMSKIVLFTSDKKEAYSFVASFRAFGPNKTEVCQIKANSIADKFPNKIAKIATFNASIVEENGVKALVIDISK